MDEKHIVLKKYFGHDEFRTGQEGIIDNILNGRDVLCIMPTGAGKSVCYQVPAMILNGITVVVSPLISLMKDQVNALTLSGVAAAFINSSLTENQYKKVIDNAAGGKYKIIYVAPERLVTSSFVYLCKKIKVAMVAVDEAHCVSQWGQDFRPSYLKINEFIETLDYRPIIGAFTATATDKVKDDVKNILKLNNPYCVTTGFDRPNLFFVVKRNKNKKQELLSLIENRKEQSGIVYCATRKTVEEVCDLLNHSDIKATRYHAGLSETERHRNQDDFVFDRKTVMVATNAFGMGIDKSNVGYVIHYNMPKNIENYYQEAGRAGRDGEKAECILLYAPKDVQTNIFLIEKSNDNPELTFEENQEVKKLDLERLRQMTFYCTTGRCLREFILNYFGEQTSNYCGNCSNCLGSFETVDITVDAQKIMSCIAKTKGTYGLSMISAILRGKSNERLLSLHLNEQSTYGIMSECTEKHIRDIVNFLCENGYIKILGGQYPVLKLTKQSLPVLHGEVTLEMKQSKEAIRERAVNKKLDMQDVDSSLLTRLKQVRLVLATKQNVPAYIVFNDASLVDMCKKLPKTTDEFLEVSGVGAKKAELYGEIFMSTIKKYTEKKSK